MGRIIALKLGDIKGDIDIAEVKDQLRVEGISFGANAQITYDSDGGGNVNLTSVSMSIKFGNWLGDITKASFGGQVFPEVIITEVDQKTEAQSASAAKVVRFITLTNAYIDSVSASWYGSTCSVNISFAFEKFAMTYNAKAGAKMASRDLMATS